MHKIIFDCERMKYANTGIYHYCLNLGKKIPFHLNHSDELLTYYIPPATDTVFGKERRYMLQYPRHKLLMPELTGFDIWHSTFQGSHYLPIRNKKIRVVLTIHDLNFLYDEHKTEKKKQHYLHRQQILRRRLSTLSTMERIHLRSLSFHTTHTNPQNHFYFLLAS
jgi:hypothetical protein